MTDEETPTEWWDDKPSMLNEVFGSMTRAEFDHRKRGFLRILAIWENNNSQAMHDPYRIMVLAKEVFCGER